MFDLVGITTKQSIELLGMFTEAIQNPLLMDRYLALKATRYVFGACRHLGDEINFKPDGIVARRAIHVLEEALGLLEEVRRDSIWDAIGRGAFADVKRTRTGGRGYAGVVERTVHYVNPLLAALESPAPASRT
jgi:beta-lysine 5,6-aminomutase alpha subunit